MIAFLKRPNLATCRPLTFEALAVLCVMGVAGFCRLHQLSTVPHGLYGDEAANGLDVLFTIPQSHPIFFEQNNGREPLFIYLQAIAVAILGPTVLSLRLTSVVVGVATTLATYWVGQEWFGRRAALLAALGLGTSFWHTHLSRVGLRAIAAPLFLTLAVVLLWRGIRRNSAVELGLSGLAVSLGVYTYLSARFVPLLVAALIVWEAITSRRAILRRWPGLAVCVVVAAVATAPLAFYFSQHTELLTRRSVQVSVFSPSPTAGGRSATLPENLRRNLGMFFVRGDENPRHNLPGRPVFSLVGAPWFVLGLAVAVVGAGQVALRRPRNLPEAETKAESPAGNVARGTPVGDEARGVACGWLVLWMGVMLVPGLLSQESPNFLRLTALAPAVYLAWGLGLAQIPAVVARLAGAVKQKPSAGLALGAALAVGVLGYEAKLTFRDYFHNWPRRADVYEAFDAGLIAVASLVEQTAGPDTSTFLYVDAHRSRAVHYLSPASREARWLQGYSNVLLLPSRADAEAVYVFSDFHYGADVAGRYLGAFEPDRVERDPAGKTVFTTYRLSASQLGSLREPALAHFAQFGSQVELLGVTPEAQAASPGDRIGLTLVWRQQTDWEGVYAPYLHVVDERGHAWGQDDLIGFAMGGWRQGDLFLSRHEWKVPVDAPPLAYKMECGMATRAFGWPPGPSVALGPPVELARVRVARTGAPAAGQTGPAVSNPLDLDLGGGLRLLGYDRSAGPLKPGDRLAMDLLWHAQQRPRRDVVVDLSLVDPAGRVWAQDRGRPAYGSYSTAEWPEGTILRDPRGLTVAGGTPSGPLHVKLLTVDASTGEELGRADLGSVQLVAPPRSFDLPRMQHTVEADFGGQIALRGFDLDAARLGPGGSVLLALYWQALASPTKNYTVFTHLLDAGDRVVGQQDNQPSRGQSPTLGWVPGQVVKDEYELKLGAEPTSGELVLEVGLYDVSSGERLRLVGGSGEDRVILATLPIVGADGR